MSCPAASKCVPEGVATRACIDACGDHRPLDRLLYGTLVKVVPVLHSFTRIRAASARGENELPSPVPFHTAVLRRDREWQCNRTMASREGLQVQRVGVAHLLTQGLGKALRADCPQCLAALCVARHQLPALKLHVLHPQPKRLKQSQPATAEKLATSHSTSTSRPSTLRTSDSDSTSGRYCGRRARLKCSSHRVRAWSTSL